MRIDIHTLSLVLCLTIFLEVIVLAIQYQKNTRYKGFLSWILGFAFFGIHFLVLFLQNFIELGIFSIIIENYLLVAGMLLLSYGVFRLFNEDGKNTLHLVFGTSYLIITGLFYYFDNYLIPSAISALSIALLSLWIAKPILKERSSMDKNLTTSISTSFVINALFFVTHAVLWFLLPFPELQDLPTVPQQISYFVIYINITIWTFTFIFLMNRREMKETIISKDKYNLMFETIPDAVMITRLSDGLFTEVNQGFTLLSGYPASEVQGKTALDINIWSDPAERSRFMVILTETGSIENMEFQFRKRNGRPLIGLLSARLIDIQGEAHALTVVRDITARKKMEDKLRENEEKYRFLTENSGDVIWHINKSYRFDYISPADEQTRGYKREEVIGTQIWPIFKPEGVQLIREKIEHHHAKEQVGNNMMVTRFEIEQLCKDGNWIWTEIVAAPHYDKYGNLIGYHGISRDITERKQLLDQLYHQATIDELTQVPNRRHFMSLAEIELRRAKRYHHSLSVVVIDFDSLKKINDTYGHLAGDRALSVFSKVVKQIIRDVDILGRFGGDEFLLLLPETDSIDAALVMERINNVLSSSPVFYGGKNFIVSVSSGIASIEDWTDTMEDLLNRADEALYESKDDGGNKTTRHNFRE